MTRSMLLGFFLAIGPLAMPVTATAADQPMVEVWKTPTCGCCKVWVEHLEDAGFQVKVNQLDDLEPIKKQFKVPPQLSSCHTARVDGYTVEGHVPADDVIRMIRTRPAIRGIFVPGMPVGSPGMEGPGGKPYDVLAVDEEGKVSVFATHKP